MERKALACGLSPEVKPASMKQEWNRGFGAFLRNPDFRRFSGTVRFLLGVLGTIVQHPNAGLITGIRTPPVKR